MARKISEETFVRALPISSYGSFQGRVSPQTRQSSATASSSPFRIRRMANSVRPLLVSQGASLGICASLVNLVSTATTPRGWNGVMAVADVSRMPSRVIGRLPKLHGGACRNAFIEKEVHAVLCGLPRATCRHWTSPFRMRTCVDIGCDERFARDLGIVIQKIIDHVAACQPPVDRID